MRIPTELEHFVTWDSAFDITFFDDNFESLNKFNEFYIGSRMYFQIAWTENTTTNFPIEFYTDSCKVSDDVSKMSFNIIKYGCGASIIDAQLLSTGAYQSQNIRWGFRSFQFSNNPAADMRIDCTIQFCLKSERNQGTCGFDPISKVCPDGYSPPI